MLRKLLYCGSLLASAVLAVAVFNTARPIDTPFDHIDEAKAAQYRDLYDRGYQWARGRHVASLSFYRACAG